MDVGPAKVRRRQTAGVRMFQCELVLTRTQVATLDDFFHDTIDAGALPFTWEHHRTGQPVDYRFTGPPEYTPLAPRGAGTEYWRATFELEAMPGTLVTGDPPDPPPVGGGGGGGESMTIMGDGGDDGGPPDPEETEFQFIPFEADSAEPEVLVSLFDIDVVEIDGEAGAGDNTDIDGVPGSTSGGGISVDPGPGEIGGETGGEFGGA